MSLANEDDEDEESQEAGYSVELLARCNCTMRPPTRRIKREFNDEARNHHFQHYKQQQQQQRKLATKRRKIPINIMLIVFVLLIWFVQAGSQLVGCQLVHQQANQTKEIVQIDSSQADASGRSAAATGGHSNQRTSRIYRIRATGLNGSFAGATLRVNPAKSRPDFESQFGDRKQQQPASSGKLQAKASRPACVEPAETVTTAETSSVSASSPTLRLTGKTPAARGDGELDESLLARQTNGAGGGEQQQVAESQTEQSKPNIQTSGEQLRPSPLPNNLDSVLSLIDEFDSKISTNKTEDEKYISLLNSTRFGQFQSRARSRSKFQRDTFLSHIIEATIFIVKFSLSQLAMSAEKILEPLRRTFSAQTDNRSKRLTRPTRIQQQQQQQNEHKPKLANLIFDDDDQQQQHEQHQPENGDDDERTHDSNRWQWIHYYQNNTQFKLIAPTFHEHLASLGNVSENLDYETIESMMKLQLELERKLATAANANNTNNHNNSTQQRLMNFAAAPLDVGGGGNKTLQSIIESIKSKLVIQKRLKPQLNANNANQHNADSMDRLAELSCDSGEMVLKLNFSQPFRGVVYPDHNRLSPCRFFGDGHHNYELRLPLRGCGSRQVAPRVFVNDVIVRFHKTLELEEDEVKTLICRYPPPLDAAVGNGQTAAGSGLLHSLDSGRFSSADNGHQQPFELIDPSSGRPATNRLAGGGGHQQSETYGELLAPAGGRHRTQSANDLLLAAPVSPADRILNRHHNALDHQLLSTSPSGIKQFNSHLAHLEAPTRLDDLRASSNSTSSFVDRLTSIELLFLISSLMFLVLLVFGLASGYYCIRRRDRRHRNLPPGSVPKLLSRQRRRRERSYLNSPTSLLGTTTMAANLSQVTPGKHYPAYQHRGGQLLGVGGRQHSASAERQNFREIYGLADPNSYYQQYLQQQQQQAQTAPSSPDDSDISGQNLLPAPSKQRLNLGGSYRPTNTSLAPMPSAHYQASTLRSTGYLPPASQQQQPPGVLGRRQNLELVNHPIDQVAGRRATFYSNNLQRGHATNNLSALRSSAVNLSQGVPNMPQTTTSTLGRRAGRLNTNQLEQDQLVNVSMDQLQDPQRHQFWPPHHVYKSADLRQHKADELAKKSANLYFAQMQHARSMQQKTRDSDQALNLDEQHKQRRHLNDERIKQKQRQHFFDTSTLTRAGTRQKQSAELRVLDVSPTVSSADSDSLVTASDSEIELTNERQRSSERPKLILKSIEDSFVTNLTEIYEQEYKKRDNMRPISMSEWRSLKLNRSQVGAESGNLGKTNEDDHEDTNQIHTGQSSQTNLRSLTELDVNFARSLLRPSLSGGKSEEKSAGQFSESSSEGQNLKASGSSGEGTQQTSTAFKSSMDDLIISPDYNCGQLKLKRSNEPKGQQPDGRSSPNNPHESSSFA